MIDSICLLHALAVLTSRSILLRVKVLPLTPNWIWALGCGLIAAGLLLAIGKRESGHEHPGL